MSDQQFPPPAQPAAKSVNVKTVWIAAALAAIIAAMAVIIVMGAQSDDKSAEPQGSVTTEESMSGTKYDDYYQYVRNKSSVANTESKATVLEFGDYVCGLLDSGYSVGEIVEEMQKYTTDSRSASEYGAAVLIGATRYICPEHSGLVEDYLG